jgi:hypothetical protein
MSMISTGFDFAVIYSKFVCYMHLIDGVGMIRRLNYFCIPQSFPSHWESYLESLDHQNLFDYTSIVRSVSMVDGRVKDNF